MDAFYAYVTLIVNISCMHQALSVWTRDMVKHFLIFVDKVS